MHVHFHFFLPAAFLLYKLSCVSGSVCWQEVTDYRNLTEEQMLHLQYRIKTQFVRWKEYHVPTASYEMKKLELNQFEYTLKLCLSPCIKFKCIIDSNGTKSPCGLGAQKFPIFFTSMALHTVPFCASPCGYFGYEYQWCYVDSINFGKYDYCSNFEYREAEVSAYTQYDKRCVTPCVFSSTDNKNMCMQYGGDNVACFTDRQTESFVPADTWKGEPCVTPCVETKSERDKPTFKCKSISGHIEYCAPPARYDIKGTYEEYFKYFDNNQHFSRASACWQKVENSRGLTKEQLLDVEHDAKIQYVKWKNNRVKTLSLTSEEPPKPCVFDCIDGKCITNRLQATAPCTVGTEPAPIYYTSMRKYLKPFCVSRCGYFGLKSEWCFVQNDENIDWEYCSSLIRRESEVSAYSKTLSDVARCKTQCKLRDPENCEQIDKNGECIGRHYCILDDRRIVDCEKKFTKTQMVPTNTRIGGFCLSVCAETKTVEPQTIPKAKGKLSLKCFALSNKKSPKVDPKMSFKSCAPPAQHINVTYEEFIKYEDYFHYFTDPSEEIFKDKLLSKQNATNVDNYITVKFKEEDDEDDQNYEDDEDDEYMQ